MQITFGKKMGIGVVLVALVGLLPLITLSYLSLKEAEKALENAAFSQLVSLREIKAKTINSYFEEREGDVHMLSENKSLMTGDGQVNDAYFKKYIKSYGYYDLFLIETDGYISYSAAKEADYHTNLATGRFKDSNLGDLYRKLAKVGDFAIADFAPYAPSNGEPAAFIGHPVFDESGKIVRYVAMQLSIEAINKVMQIRDGMGETGETYLVGSDKLMRSDSFLDPKNHTVLASFANPEVGKVDTNAVNRALAGTAGVDVIQDYNNNLVLSAYAPLKVAGLNWVVIAEIDMAEVDIPIIALEQKVYFIGAVAGVFVILIIVLVAWTAKGEVSFLSRIVQDLGASSDQVAAASTQISSGAQQVSQGATEQAASLEEVSATMEQISGQAKANAESSERTAEAALKMAGLVEQSYENSDHASKLSVDAMKAAELGVKAMSQISDSMKDILVTSSKITDIIEVINDITHQTKMLATNAAIEAARAGDQGKGFAVVADEVSKLAEHSKSSAKEIAGLIKESDQKSKQGSSYVDSGAKVLGEIFANARELSALIDGISAFSSQQGLAMDEVKGQVQNIRSASDEQATGLDQVSEAIGQLDQVTQTNAANAEESASAAEELNSQAEALKELILNVSHHFGVTLSKTEIKHHRPVTQALLPHPEDHKPLQLHGGKVAPKKGYVNPNKAIPMQDNFNEF